MRVWKNSLLIHNAFVRTNASSVKILTEQPPPFQEKKTALESAILILVQCDYFLTLSTKLRMPFAKAIMEDTIA